MAYFDLFVDRIACENTLIFWFRSPTLLSGCKVKLLNIINQVFFQKAKEVGNQQLQCCLLELKRVLLKLQDRVKKYRLLKLGLGK